MLLNIAPWSVFWMVPPEPAVEPSPVTVRPPLVPAVPVLLSTMPLVPPFALMSWKVRPEVPILVLTTLSAVPVVVVRWLVPVTLIVPPPLALKAFAVPVDSAMPPLKSIVEPVLLDRLIDPSVLPVVPIVPVKDCVPAVMLLIETTVPVESLMAPSSVKFSVPLDQRDVGAGGARNRAAMGMEGAAGAVDQRCRWCRRPRSGQ